MSCWQVLGIEATGDKKVIKKAYAVSLKKNKPDENPEGFSRLHAAYQEALALARQAPIEEKEYAEPAYEPQEQLSENTPIDLHTPDSDEPSPDEAMVIDAALAEELGEPSVQTDNRDLVISDEWVEADDQAQSASSEQDQARQEYLESLNRAWENIAGDTQVALVAMFSKKEPDVWQFLSRYDELYDFQFKQEYSAYLFTTLCTFFDDNQLKPADREEALRYIDHYFHWVDQEVYIYSLTDSPTADEILDLLLSDPSLKEKRLQWTVKNYHEGPLEYGNYFARLAATFIDMFVILLVATAFTEDRETIDTMILTVLLYALIIPIMEASSMQGSPSKVLFGMKVTNKQGRRMSIWQAYWRQLWFLLSCFTGKVTVWINVFLGNRLLHDRFSYSLVIKR